jgi:hypothetical protein
MAASQPKLNPNIAGAGYTRKSISSQIVAHDKHGGPRRCQRMQHRALLTHRERDQDQSKREKKNE